MTQRPHFDQLVLAIIEDNGIGWVLDFAARHWIFSRSLRRDLAMRRDIARPASRTRCVFPRLGPAVPRTPLAGCSSNRRAHRFARAAWHRADPTTSYCSHEIPGDDREPDKQYANEARYAQRPEETPQAFHRVQSPSASRFTAGAFGFFALSQSSVRPD